MSKPKVAFICVHNSCRSHIAEALGRYYASHVFYSYSAGTKSKPQINQDAVRLIKEIYGIDMEKHNDQNYLMKYRQWILLLLWDVMIIAHIFHVNSGKIGD